MTERDVSWARAFFECAVITIAAFIVVSALMAGDNALRRALGQPQWTCQYR